MKIEVGKEFPQYFKPSYPEEFELFSHLETTAAIPTVLFAITTWKENGKPNVCFHAWSCFHSDKTAFFAVMGNLYQHTHTYANIQREKCFCINFLPISYYDKLVDTINHNDDETDEFSVGKFSLVDAKTIHAPMIQEAFINMECTLKETQDLSGAGITSMIIGQVQHISVDAERTFWEKVTILHKIANFPEGKALPHRYARHLYDVYCLGNSDIKKSAFIRKELLEKDVAFKQKFYYAKSAHYETATLKTIKLMPSDKIMQPLRNDYTAMSNMFYGIAPEFDEILTYLEKLENEIHNL